MSAVRLVSVKIDMILLSGHSGTTTSVLELLYIRPEQVSRYLHYLNLTIYTNYTIYTIYRPGCTAAAA